ncbi:MAG: hypothetical protein NWS64_00300, partial [Microbacteriaceae bacterium]|nr:hypothetical protein [Microbacteriaceae bacterium]
AKYLGLWWSAGSPGNSIELYSEGEIVAFMSVDGILELLQEGTATTVGGPSVNTDDYAGNPRNTALSPGEPFVYLNLYGTGGVSFDQIKIMGGGFEFDNIAVSDLPQVPGSTEVAVEFIPGENDPAAGNEEPLANTGVDGNKLAGVGLFAVGLTVAAIALRRKRALV